MTGYMCEAGEPCKANKLQDEFRQVCETLRHYSNLRFVVLTLFFGFVGADVAFIYAKETPPRQVVFAAKTAGLYGTFAFWFVEFWFVEYKIWGYIGLLEVRAYDLETALKYNILKSRTERKDKTGNVERCKQKVQWVFWQMYGVVLLFWVMSFIPCKLPSETAPIKEQSSARPTQLMDLKPLVDELQSIQIAISNSAAVRPMEAWAPATNFSSLVGELQNIERAISNSATARTTAQVVPATDFAKLATELGNIECTISNAAAKLSSTNSLHLSETGFLIGIGKREIRSE